MAPILGYLPRGDRKTSRVLDIEASRAEEDRASSCAVEDRSGSLELWKDLQELLRQTACLQTRGR